MAHSKDDRLQQAFRQTRYLVEHSGGVLTILVNQPPPALLQKTTWLIITADNPQAKKITAKENELRRATLLQNLQQLALPLLATRHVDPTGTWPDEHGWLVMTDADQAKQQWLWAQVIELGRKFDQRALLSHQPAADRNAAPARVRLLWL